MKAIANDRQRGALEEYSKLKLQLAGTLRILLHLAEQRKDEMGVADCRQLLARLAEDRLNLAMVGQFSRGKSSLMNALLGAEKLPTGILPLTSVITTVAYGESQRVLLQREGWTFPQEIRLDQLPEYVTQHGNPGNQKKVMRAEIQLPHEMLRLGVHFIDTPGIASSIRANTRTTRQFLPEVDAAILVTSFESPLAETELDFLREVWAHVHPVFIVVNKHDLVPADERAQVVDAIRHEIRAAFDCQCDVFTVSARDALHAKQSGSREELEASGLPALESALTTFLRSDKARQLLLRAADRTESVARQQAISIRISERARTPKNAKDFELRLQEVICNINRERQALIKRLLDTLQVEFPRRCRETIHLWGSDSEAFLVSQSRKWFWRDGEIAGDAFQRFLKDLSQKLFSQSISRDKEEIDHVFAEITRQEGATLEDLVSKICTIPAEVLTESRSSEGPLSRPLEVTPLNFRVFDMPVQQFQLPWWFDLIPKGRPRELAYRHWQRRMPEFVRIFEHSAQAELGIAVEDWVTNMNRQLESRIEGARSHLVKLLHDKGNAPRLSDIEDIIGRVQEFREVVQQLGEGGEFGVPMVPRGMNAQERRSVLRQCSICSRLERTLWDFMARAQYELSVSEERQRQHAARSGFCPLHTWQYETISSPQGVCAAYPEVLTRFAERLRALAEDLDSVQSMDNALRAMLPSNSSCEACDLLASEERVAAEQIAGKISRNNGDPPPLCAYHLHTVLAVEPDKDAARRLILDQARAFEDLAEEMQDFVLKHIAVRHHLTTKTESRAAMAGLSRLVGSHRIAGPWRID
jgi:small GTP-binding protein